MRFIQQLTSIINPQLSHNITSVPSDNMLEQFYTIYIMRLYDKALLTQLSSMTDISNLFEKIWAEKSHRAIICHELSLSHHLQEEVTLQLISEASPLVYQQIKQQANKSGLTIFDLLQQNVDDIKPLLPMWVDLVIAKEILTGEPQTDIEPTHIATAPVKKDNDVTEIVTSKLTLSIDSPNNTDNNINNEQPSTYISSPKRAKQKKAPSRRKKTTNSQNNTQLKKILIIVIPLVILNVIIVGAWLWVKKTSEIEETEVILTPQQPNNQNMITPSAQQPQTNNQDIAVFSGQAPQSKNQITAVPPAQPAQSNKQITAVPPAQPAQSNKQITAVPPAQPAQPMNIVPTNPQNTQQIPAYNEPPVVNNQPSQEPMSMTQSPNEMIFEFNNNDEGGISEAQFDELSQVEIISEKSENQP